MKRGFFLELTGYFINILFENIQFPENWYVLESYQPILQYNLEHGK